MAMAMAMAMRNKLGVGRLMSNWNKRGMHSTIAFEEITGGGAGGGSNKISTAIIIHGLLGSSRNWRSFARNLSSHLSSGWRLVLVDLRNHGRSSEVQGLDPPHNLENAAQDIANLVISQGWDWPRVVIGHSLGGKVALHFVHSATRNATPLPKQLWVLDSVPGPVNPQVTSGEVEKVLDTLQTLPSQISSRKWLVDHLTNLGFSKSMSEWLVTNLNKSNGHYKWTYNFQGVNQMFHSYRENDYWSLLEHPPKGTEISVVRAENSDRWEPQIIQKLEMLANKEQDGSEGKVSLHVLPKAGHWVHVDNPKGLLEILAPRIASLD